jgi:hypothetical protein
VALLAMTAAVLGALFCTCVAAMKNRDLALWLLLGAAGSVISVFAIVVLPALDDDGRPVR